MIPKELRELIDKRAKMAEGAKPREYRCKTCEDGGLVWVRHQSPCGYSYFGALRCTCNATFPRGPNGRMEYGCGYSEKIPTFTSVGLTEKDIFTPSQREQWEVQAWLHADAQRDPAAQAEREAIQGEE